jgi:hypothetical protein
MCPGVPLHGPAPTSIAVPSIGRRQALNSKLALGSDVSCECGFFGELVPATPTTLSPVASRTCWNCGVLANMTPVPESGTRRDPIESGIRQSVFTNLMACFRCDGCDALNIRSMWTGDVINPHLDAAEIAAMLTDESPFPGVDTGWHPVNIRGKQYADVPADIAAAASEAHTCIAVKAYRGAVLLARSVVEATAKDKGMTTGTLVTKIDAMYEARLIREDIRDGAHEVRYLANDAAHGDFVEPVSPTDAELILTLMDEVLEEVYQSPARVARRRAARLDNGTTT